MRNHIVVEKTPSSVNILDASVTDSTLRNSAAQSIFPSGSNWSKYVGHRAFKFTGLENDYYLLSYVLVLGYPHGYYDGALRAWGILSTSQDFISEFRRLQSMSDFFLEYANQFSHDPLASVMLESLKRNDKNLDVRLGCSWPLVWARLQIGIKTVFLYDAKHPQYSEKVIALAFKSTLWKAVLGGFLGVPTLASFSTLSLSNSEPVQIVALPA